MAWHEGLEVDNNIGKNLIYRNSLDMLPPAILEETISFASRCFVTGFVSTSLSLAIAAVLIITGRILPSNEPMPC